MAHADDLAVEDVFGGSGGEPWLKNGKRSASFRVGDAASAKSPGGIPTSAQVRLLGALLDHMYRRGGGVVLLSMGVHYNANSRGDYDSCLRMVLPLLDAYAQRCKYCVAMMRTANAQHFPDPSGAMVGLDFVTSIKTAASSGYYCSPLQQLGANMRSDSPMCWRATNPLRVLAELELQHVLVVPLGRVLEDRWDTHIGVRVKAKGQVTDCLHHCFGPS
eukprot:276548-Prymnesium_polylepis.1